MNICDILVRYGLWYAIWLVYGTSLRVCNCWLLTTSLPTHVKNEAPVRGSDLMIFVLLAICAVMQSSQESLVVLVSCVLIQFPSQDVLLFSYA